MNFAMTVQGIKDYSYGKKRVYEKTSMSLVSNTNNTTLPLSAGTEAPFLFTI